MKFLCANRIAPDRTPQKAASHLGLCCVPMFRKKGTTGLNESRPRRKISKTKQNNNYKKKKKNKKNSSSKF